MNRWLWKALYHDGTTIVQETTNPATGREWSSDHLDLEKLKCIVLYPTDPGVSKIILEVKPGEKFKRFWRQYIQVDGGASGTCWVIGLEKNDVTFYNFFRPDGSWVLSSDLEGSEFTL